MYTIVVFNYNYSRYLTGLFSSFQSLLRANVPYNIFFCDDGSTDNSLDNAARLSESLGISNIYFLNISKSPNNRVKPYQGQLEGLKLVCDVYEDLIFDNVFLIDSDDHYDEAFFETNRFDFLHDCDFTFFKVVNGCGGIFEDPVVIKRRADQVEGIWPTITPTSGICLNKDVLFDFYDEIFNLSSSYDDVWLDSRLNMIASFRKSVYYSDKVVRRLIHGGNDSARMSFKRALLKQFSAMNYYRSIFRGNVRFSFRFFVLDVMRFFVK